MIRCTFHLNGYQLSTLSCPGLGFFPHILEIPGITEIILMPLRLLRWAPYPKTLLYRDTSTGGFGTHWHDAIKGLESGSNRDFWFALYRHDTHIDDRTFINNVERGSFRLHPAGQSGISNGCITLPNHSHYRILMHGLLASGTFKVTAGLDALGTIQVY